MTTRFTLEFGSRLARHRHVSWTDTSLSGTAVTIPDYVDQLRMDLQVASFDQTLVALRYGRFYPAHVLRPPARPPGRVFRVVRVGDTDFTADFNHPLAGREIATGKSEVALETPAVGRPDLLIEWAGIESPPEGGDTDFSDRQAFDRQDPADDSIFYANPRKVLHVDRTCISRITALYGELLPAEGAVLDLMSSWRSHLPEFGGRVTGLGMNAGEMADNPRLHGRIVHDLNKDPVLPFDERSFDAVVNTVSIEYLVRPASVLAEVRRVLKPGGVVIVAFSNRYFPPKTIRIWEHLHPAERLGFVVQMLGGAGFSGLHTHAERGLERSDDDRYSGQVDEMDPLFAAWGFHR